MAYYDSAGRPIAIGSTVRWRGRIYTIKSFHASAGCHGECAAITFNEPHHLSETPDEWGVDLVETGRPTSWEQGHTYMIENGLPKSWEDISKVWPNPLFKSPPSAKTNLEIFAEGAKAKSEGISNRECPYDNGKLFFIWQAGWHGWELL